ncbi:MAG: histidine kinase [Alicyclobacillaceae bacterium]|nr:histidine kinase [Alicyclobacillaceae bacterium]
MPKLSLNKIAVFYEAMLAAPAIYLFEVPNLMIRYTGFLLIAVFGWAYWTHFQQSSKRERLITIQIEMFIVFFLIWFANPEFCFLLFYIIACITSLPQRQERVLYFFEFNGICVLEFGLLAFLHMQPWNELLPVFLTGAISSLGMSFFMRQKVHLKHTNQELSEATRTIERLTRTAERERIARELHDVMGHELTGISLKAQLAQRLLEKGANEDARIELGAIEESARGALTRVRGYISETQKDSLVTELFSISRFLHSARITCHLEVQPLLEMSDDFTSTVVACIRELCTNMARHSGATEAWIDIRETHSTLRLQVEDNGTGLAQSRTGNSQTGYGLTGLCSRIEAMNGTVQIWSNGTHRGGSHVDEQPPLHSRKGVCVLIDLPQAVEDKGHSLQRSSSAPMSAYSQPWLQGLEWSGGEPS